MEIKFNINQRVFVIVNYLKEPILTGNIDSITIKNDEKIIYRVWAGYEMRDYREEEIYSTFEEAKQVVLDGINNFKLSE